MNAWVLLAGAVLCEVTGSLTLKAAQNHRWLYAVVVLGYVAAFVFLNFTLRAGLGLGVAYAVWSAFGIAITALGSKVIYSEQLNLVMWAGFTFIIGGVALVELGASR